MSSINGCTKYTDNTQSEVLNADIQSSSDVSSQQWSSEEVPVEDKTSIPESYIITSKNYFDYQPGLECAAFSSAYLLRHYGKEADGLKLYETFPGKLSGGGATPYGIETYFNDNGYIATFKTDGTIENLKKQVSKGDPVIVFIHIEEPYETTHNTHYIPLIGYDKDNFYFAESLKDYANCKDEKDISYNRKTTIEKFMRLWDNIDGYWDNPYFVIEEKTADK